MTAEDKEINPIEQIDTRSKLAMMLFLLGKATGVMAILSLLLGFRTETIVLIAIYASLVLTATVIVMWKMLHD
jgi:hypothetical protein